MLTVPSINKQFSDDGEQYTFISTNKTSLHYYNTEMKKNTLVYRHNNIPPPNPSL